MNFKDICLSKILLFVRCVTSYEAIVIFGCPMRENVSMETESGREREIKKHHHDTIDILTLSLDAQLADLHFSYSALKDKIPKNCGLYLHRTTDCVNSRPAL
jgi:hypothetical protein